MRGSLGRSLLESIDRGGGSGSIREEGRLVLFLSAGGGIRGWQSL